jgi:hypothetical protein
LNVCTKVPVVTFGKPLKGSLTPTAVPAGAQQPLHDPAGDPTYEPPQPVTDPSRVGAPSQSWNLHEFHSLDRHYLDLAPSSNGFFSFRRTETNSASGS